MDTQTHLIGKYQVQLHLLDVCLPLQLREISLILKKEFWHFRMVDGKHVCPSLELQLDVAVQFFQYACIMAVWHPFG